jgi:hypothetical protein
VALSPPGAVRGTAATQRAANYFTTGWTSTTCGSASAAAPASRTSKRSGLGCLS